MNRWLKRLLPAVVVGLALLLALVTPAAGREVFVAVQSDNPDGALMADPDDLFGEAVAYLKLHEGVEVLDETNRHYLKVRRTNGQEGWVLRSAVRNEKLTGGSDGASAGTGASSAGTLAKGFNRATESGLTDTDPNFKKNIQIVDKLEEVRNSEFGGASGMRDAYRKFALDGGLTRSSP